MTFAIPKYTLVEKLGEGGMATVWIARRDHDARLSVIKVLHEHLAEDAVVQSRFLREAQVAALLDHPNIARLYDAGRVGSQLYLAMELIPGQDVEALMVAAAGAGRLLPSNLTTYVGLRALEGLYHAHEFRGPDGAHLSIVHRDLSPRNVMVTFDGGVKLIDFGLVRTSLGDFRTSPGMIAGTLRYMSPEQATADLIDHRSDLYTLGVVLYEMYTGQPVVRGADTKSILGAVVVDSPPPLSERNPNLPKGLDQVLAKAMDKDRERRFSNALDFRDALALAAGELGVVSERAIAEMVAELAPAAKAKALERASAAPASPPVEETRVASAPEQIPTRAARLMPPMPVSAPPPEASSRRTVLALVATSVAAVLGVAALIVEPEPTELAPPIAAPPPPAPPIVTVSSQVAVEPSPEGQGKAMMRPAKSTDRKATVTPPPAPRVVPAADPPPTRVESYDALERDAISKLGPDEAREFLARCIGPSFGDDPKSTEFRRLLEKCRRDLDGS
jgi:serine/threonine-protein kinase